MRPLSEYRLAFRSAAGELLAYVTLTPIKEGEGAAAPLVAVDAVEAREHGETLVQLREAERYEYEVSLLGDQDLRLRCSLASRRKSLKPGSPDAGLIETRSFCGTLLMELVDGAVDAGKPALASALIDVRSVKLDYRTEYRGMLRRLSAELVGLVADARSSAKLGFCSSFEDRTDEGWLQLQLELLREIIDGAHFSAALQRIVNYPHERLTSANDSVATDRPLRWTPSAVRQMIARNPRRPVPTGHPLRVKPGMASIAERVTVSRKVRNLDTLENRFVKFVLLEFRAFLAHAGRVFAASPGWGASAALARRLEAVVEIRLQRDFFPDLSMMRFAPLGSPVLQRKQGYREVLHWWLRFRSSAELSWSGGEDVFHAGQRDVARLYEYWLFFELLDWFCRTYRAGARPAVEELVEGLEENQPALRLRHRVEIGPFRGVFTGHGRGLNARFAYNRRFSVSRERRFGGSWTRPLHPDYTLTFWPESLSEAEAEQFELLVHVHFDAKYRVEDITALFGEETSEDADEPVEGNYRRQDLLKMHAYRDAIKRTQGAYVLYPGRSGEAVTFRGFHEILPGLGAFSVSPDETGQAQGLDSLERFLDAVLAHLSNRTTAQERVSYHVSTAYSRQDEPVAYGALRLPETDMYGPAYRALPPAEHMVLVAWYRTSAQQELAVTDDGFVYVRLGRRSGSFHVHPNLAQVRHVLLRTSGGVVAPGLLQLRESGFRVYTRSQLRRELRSRAGMQGIAAWEASADQDDDEHIYALFRTTEDPIYRDLTWRGDRLTDLIEAFESDARNKPVVNLGRTSPYPRILPLRDLLKARMGMCSDSS